MANHFLFPVLSRISHHRFSLEDKRAIIQTLAFYSHPVWCFRVFSLVLGLVGTRQKQQKQSNKSTVIDKTQSEFTIKW